VVSFSGFPTNILYLFLFPHSCHMPRPSHSPWLITIPPKHLTKMPSFSLSLAGVITWFETQRQEPPFTHSYYQYFGVSDYRRGMYWWMDILNTCAHHSELQAITVPLLIFTIHMSPAPVLNLFPACCFFTSPSLATASNSTYSSASRVQILSSQPPVQNSTLNWQLTPRLAAISHKTPSLLLAGWV
jgi:hypothetical protein